MAHDPQLKSRVRATYESNNLSFVKVHELFPDIVSHKTIEGWARQDKKEGSPWVKNRYTSLAEAVDAVVELNLYLLQESATNAIKKEMKGVPVELVDDRAYIEALGKSEIKKSLTKKSLVEMMEENLLSAYDLARNSGHINTKATFQMMAKSVMESKYGKNINVGTLDMSSINSDEIAQMSQEQLIELANDLKE